MLFVRHTGDFRAQKVVCEKCNYNHKQENSFFSPQNDLYTQYYKGMVKHTVRLWLTHKNRRKITLIIKMCMCEKASSFHVCLVFDFLDLMSHGKG